MIKLKSIKRVKGISLFETLVSLTLIVLAFFILFQTFIFQKDTQFEKSKNRIELRNDRCLKLMGESL